MTASGRQEIHRKWEKDINKGKPKCLIEEN